MTDLKVQHRKLEVIRYDIDSMKEFIGSRGWAIMRDALDGEQQAVMRKLTDPDIPDRCHLDFYRAALGNIRSLRQFPDTILQTLENELKIAESVSTPKEK